MSLSVGIVGLPNAGKSTLFNALLKKQQALAANYPFATIEPNVGIVPVPDERLEKLAEVVAASDSRQARMTKKPPIVPATVQFVDIAGLVAGAAKGEGLGNKFLAHIREVDLIVHVMRAFVDPDVVHVTGEVDADKDKDIIETELIFTDMQTLERVKSEKSKVKSDGEESKRKIAEKLYNALNDGKLARQVGLTDKERESVRDLHLLTMKPVLYVQNVGENQLTDTSVISDLIGDPDNTLDSRVRGNDNTVVISAKVEAELASLSEDEQKEYLQGLGLEQSGLERLISKAYDLLGLISFLTAGEIEVRAWTIAKGTTAAHAAGTIHTDFAKKFIKAAVIPFEKFLNPNGLASPKPSDGGWKKAYETGAVQLEGRDYVVKDGDVVEFKVGS